MPQYINPSWYSHPWQYLVRGWLYRVIIFSHLMILVSGWLYRDIIFSFLAIFGEGVIISWHYIFIPGNIWWGGDYILTIYFHSWQYLVRGWLYRDIIFSLLAIFGEGVIISWHYISIPGNIWWGGWLYRDIILSLLAIFGEGVIISWHYIFIPGYIWWGGDYIVTLMMRISIWNCTCAWSMALDKCTEFQLEIVIRRMTSIIHKFCENVLESSRNISETTPWPLNI